MRFIGITGTMRLTRRLAVHGSDLMRKRCCRYRVVSHRGMNEA